MEWPSWDEVLDEASCNLEGVFTQFEPYTYYDGRCVSYDELVEIFAE